MTAGRADVLDRRALNRALLARQLLLARSPMPVPDAVGQLVGLQAQAPTPPYVALWSRLADFRPEELGSLLVDRGAARIALMRSTIHLVSAADCGWLRPLVQPVLARGLQGNFGRYLQDLDVDAVAVAGRELVEERPRTFAELGEALTGRWPGRDRQALAMVVRTYVPLVQVPPRGVWGASGSAAHTSAESWFGRPMVAEPAADDLVLRYLSAFGPASVRDVQAWSGLTRLRPVVDRLRPALRTFRDERGVELFDLPDAPRPPAGTPAPPRFLPEWDNALLSHADRTRIVTDDHRAALAASSPVPLGAVLVDGFVRAGWRVTREAGAATMRITPFGTFSPGDREAVAVEGERLLRFVAADAGTHEVRIGG